jgi:hypothetical protein
MKYLMKGKGAPLNESKHLSLIGFFVGIGSADSEES